MNSKAHKYLNAKGDICFELNDFKESLECYSDAIELKPLNIYLNNKGFTLMHMQRFNEAIEYHDEALKSDPNDSLSYNYKSNNQNLRINKIFKVK